MSEACTTFAAQVTALRLEADGIVSVELQAPDRAPLPAWTPGAHIDVLLPSGLTRQYSLCGDPRQRDRMRIAVLLEANGRGGSRAVHDLRLGQRLELRGPRNAFPLDARDSYLFVAGGIGITPILPMIAAAAEAGADWRLIYGGRARRSMAFLDELACHGERVSVHPADERGPLDVAAICRRAADGAHIYSCGPGGLLDALSDSFASAGLAERLHLERFGAAPLAAQAGDGTLLVTLARSKAQVDVPPGVSIMAALREAGHQVASSCEQGVCGMCEARVLEGVPDHRDMLLTESERQRGDVMMLCVSRACTPALTLDL